MSWRRPGLIGALLYAVAALFFGGLVTFFARLRIARQRGRRRAVEKLPDGAIIIIANHASYADGILLALVCRRMGRSIRLLATSGVFRAPLIGGVASRVGFIPVERGTERAAKALEPALEALAQGEAVGLFPEGRTTRDPNHWPERAKTGAARLALLSGAPIVPVAMVGTHKLLEKGHLTRSIVRSVFMRPEVLVEVGAPINLRALASPDPSPEEIRELADYAMGKLIAAVATLRGEVAEYPAGVEAPATSVPVLTSTVAPAGAQTTGDRPAIELAGQGETRRAKAKAWAKRMRSHLPKGPRRK